MKELRVIAIALQAETENMLGYNIDDVQLIAQLSRN
jgi:hypothetical protein